MEVESLFKVPYLVVGSIGGAVSIMLGENKPKTLREYFKSTALVLSGAVITNFLTPFSIKLLPILEGVEHGAGLVIGLFGIGVVSALLKVTKDLRTDFWGTLKKAKDLFKE